VAFLAAGKTAPLFTLNGSDGKRYSLAEALNKGPVLLAFFKVSCPVCQFTFPYVERLFERYGGGPLTIWGISQDDARDTNEFRQEFEITFPALIDTDRYEVSNDYRISNVPTLFLIDPSGKIALSETGFSKPDIENIAAQFAAICKTPPSVFFAPSEIVPNHKPG
jgi:peroxiredoxin